MSLRACHRFAIILLVAVNLFLCFITTTKIVFSQDGGEADEKPPQFPSEVRVVQTVIVDKDGMPISGAKADVYAMRCIEERGSHYGWPSGNLSPGLRKSISDDDGSIEFRYPVQFGSPQKWLNTCEISISILHPLFVPHTIDLDLAQEQKSITLKSGCKLSITASDLSSKPIDQFYPYIPGEAALVQWKHDAGVFSTGGLPAGKLLCLLASPNKDGTLFSRLMEIETNLDQAVLKENIPLKRGKRLFGNLPAEVPRPIVDGQVSIHALLEGDAPLAGMDSIAWDDWCEVAPDGSFEFPSIPAPAQVQVIAMCRDWLIKSPEVDFFIKGKTFDCSRIGEELEIAFEMEPTGSLELELMTTDGDPVVGAEVITCPNRFALAGYSTGLESNFRSLNTAERFLHGETVVKPEKPKPGRFYQVSNEEGHLKLYDIPASRKQSLHVGHPNYILPIPIGQEDNDIDYTVQPGETNEKLLILEKRTPK